MGWFVIVEKYRNIRAGSGDTLQNFVKCGNSQHIVTKTSLLTPTVCQQPWHDMMKVPNSGVTVTSVLRGADLDEVKEFMKGGFYTTALQCKALRLGELSNEEGHIVDQEIGKQITCLCIHIFN